MRLHFLYIQDVFILFYAQSLRIGRRSRADVSPWRGKQLVAKSFEVETELSQEDLGAGRGAFKDATDGDIPRKYISNELLPSEDYYPYTQDGHVKLHRGEHRIKAESGFLESIAPARKNLQHLGSVENASASAGWLKTLLAAVQACEKASNALRSGKWDARAQLPNAWAILSALVETGKAFNGRAHAFSPDTVLETEFDRNRKAIHALGAHTPSWMQKLAQGDLSYVTH